MEKHFVDSLSIVKTIDLKSVNKIIDVGTGAGFPGIFHLTPVLPFLIRRLLHQYHRIYMTQILLLSLHKEFLIEEAVLFPLLFPFLLMAKCYGIDLYLISGPGS